MNLMVKIKMSAEPLSGGSRKSMCLPFPVLEATCIP